MSLTDIFVMTGLAVAIVFAIVWVIRRRKRGKTGCGCCPYCDAKGD